MNTLKYESLGDGVHAIETHYYRDGIAVCYLLHDGDEAALIDTGTARTTDDILRLLDHLGIARAQVRYVIPTHVHLDHAGGSGQLMAALPQATLVVHPFGARHLIDPRHLAAATEAVYGAEAFARNFVELLPVDAQRVVEAGDGLRLELGGRELELLHTPGHARHHLCVWDPLSRGWFTGDTFGIAYPELATDRGPFMFLPSTPVQFDPPAWHRTLERLMAYRPERIYLTHYGRIEQPQQRVGALREEIDAYATIARQAGPAENRQARLESALWGHILERLRRHGSTLEEAQIRGILGMDVTLCAQGLEAWLARQERSD